MFYFFVLLDTYLAVLPLHKAIALYLILNDKFTMHID